MSGRKKPAVFNNRDIINLTMNYNFDLYFGVEGHEIENLPVVFNNSDIVNLTINYYTRELSAEEALSALVKNFQMVFNNSDVVNFSTNCFPAAGSGRSAAVGHNMEQFRLPSSQRSLNNQSVPVDFGISSGVKRRAPENFHISGNNSVFTFVANSMNMAFGPNGWNASNMEKFRLPSSLYSVNNQSVPVDNFASSSGVKRKASETVHIGGNHSVVTVSGNSSHIVVGGSGRNASSNNNKKTVQLSPIQRSLKEETVPAYYYPSVKPQTISFPQKQESKKHDGPKHPTLPIHELVGERAQLHLSFIQKGLQFRVLNGNMKLYETEDDKIVFVCGLCIKNFKFATTDAPGVIVYNKAKKVLNSYCKLNHHYKTFHNQTISRKFKPNQSKILNEFESELESAIEGVDAAVAANVRDLVYSMVANLMTV